MRHKTFFASIVRFPDRHGPIPPGSFPGKVDKICGGHGQGETPGPIPNPEAKALHGDGTAPERVWESSAPPLSHDTVPPGRAPTGSRGVPRFPHARTASRHSGIHISSYSFVSIRTSIHSFFLFLPPSPPHIHSYPFERPSVPSLPSSLPSPYSFIPSLSVHPSCGRGGRAPRRARRRRGTGSGGHGELRGGPRMPPHGPGGGTDGQGKAGKATGRRPWFI